MVRMDGFISLQSRTGTQQRVGFGLGQRVPQRRNDDGTWREFLGGIPVWFVVDPGTGTGPYFTGVTVSWCGAVRWTRKKTAPAAVAGRLQAGVGPFRVLLSDRRVGNCGPRERVKLNGSSVRRVRHTFSMQMQMGTDVGVDDGMGRDAFRDV
ncbi:hypothetical protein CKAH01_09846 [Colletotrichum kahawae]|uniref:Uncharacterized protein n=1 Tax=Colletotrichum kahawae TaxID=34407 RepID=A0AAE0CZT6_COLKA|nr:hypothetical protein CKAH01_09846 [Colletotrichum kahawae]